MQLICIQRYCNGTFRVGCRRACCSEKGSAGGCAPWQLRPSPREHPNPALGIISTMYRYATPQELHDMSSLDKPACFATLANEEREEIFPTTILASRKLPVVSQPRCSAPARQSLDQPATDQASPVNDDMEKTAIQPSCHLENTMVQRASSGLDSSSGKNRLRRQRKQCARSRPI